jgi:hypothetical protein
MWNKSLNYRKKSIYYYLLWQVANQFSDKNKVKANAIYQKLSQQDIRLMKSKRSKEYKELRQWYEKTMKENLTSEEYRSQTRPSLWQG